MQPGVIEPMSVDPLTGLPRREFLRQRFMEDCRGGSAISLLVIDLDHFAKINEQYLIPGGDQILTEVARLIRREARPGDLVVRDGGDQFSIVLYAADQRIAVAEAERIRAAVAVTPIPVRRGNDLLSAHVTVSVGIATLIPDDADAWKVFERARIAVHEAKAGGRNRIAVG